MTSDLQLPPSKPFDAGILRERLDVMPRAEYEAMFGFTDVDPLSAFSKMAGYHQRSRRRHFMPGKKAASHINDCFKQKESLPLRTAYINIPFCKGRCLYCTFFWSYHREDQVKVYIDHLIREIQQAGESVFVKSHPFCAVYIGGGTPSNLHAEDIKRLLNVVRTYLPLSNDVEISMECRLSGFDESRLEAALEGGVNRFSVGVQSFDTQIRRTMGRKLTGDEVMIRLDQLARIGHGPIVTDLIYGLPDQDMEIWEQDLRDLLQCSADGVSAYMLRTESNSPLEMVTKAGLISPGPSLSERCRMYLRARERFIAAGYHRLDMTHWARVSRERAVYESQAKADQDIIGFGAGSYWQINGFAMLNYPKVVSYQRKVARGENPVMFCIKRPPETRLYYGIGDEMGQGGVSFDRVQAKWGFDLRELLEPVCERWSSMGLMIRKEGIYLLTPVGEFWRQNMTQTMIDCLDLACESFHPDQAPKRV